MAERLTDGTTDASHEHLSPRELEVFRSLTRGEGPREIAAALGLSVKSISTCRIHVPEKLGLPRKADLTRYVPEHGPARLTFGARHVRRPRSWWSTRRWAIHEAGRDRAATARRTRRAN